MSGDGGSDEVKISTGTAGRRRCVRQSNGVGFKAGQGSGNEWKSNARPSVVAQVGWCERPVSGVGKRSLTHRVE